MRRSSCSPTEPAAPGRISRWTNNVETVTEICHRLDGMPLAIELAAARVRALTLDEIVDSLHDRFRLLTGGARTAVRRQQTLRASVDWSHALLTEPERVLLRRLSVFMGGFDLDAAQSVAGTTDVERYQVLDQLSLLVDKSLVIAENAGGRTRYRLLETVRQYALEKLGESGEADDIRGRHRDHYTAWRSDSTRRRVARRSTSSNRPISRSTTCARRSSGVAKTTTSQVLWSLRHRSIPSGWREGASRRERHGSTPHWRRERAVSEVAPRVHAKALADRAVLGLWVEGAGMREASRGGPRDRPRDRRSRPAVTSAHRVRPAHIHDYESARAVLHRGNRSCPRNRRSIGGSARSSAGNPTARSRLGTFIEAETIAREGLELADALGDHFGSAQCRVCSGCAHVFRGEAITAIDMTRDLIVRATSAHDLMSKVIGLFELTFALAFRGDVPAPCVGDATIEAGSECPGLLANGSFNGRRRGCLADGDAAAAREAALAAERDRHRHSRSGRPAHGLDGPSRLGMWRTGRRPHAEPTIAVSASKGIWLSTALSTRACVRVAQGEYEQAAADAYEALMIANESGTHLSTADTLECLARMAFGADNPAEATSPTRSRGIDEGSGWVSSASRFSTTTTMRWSRHCETPWASERFRRGMDRGRGAVDQRKPSPTRCVVAASANGRRPAGDRLLRPSSTSSASSPRAYPTRTSPPDCSSHRERCSHTSATSTTSSG